MAINKVRIDKWLWSVRIFKSRSIAANACRSNRVKINDEIVKPASDVTEGDIVKVRKEGFNLTFKVKKLIERRVSAALAQPCYENLTPPEELNKYRDWFIGKASPERREKGAGRPTKRERREIDQFKDDFLDEDELI